MKRIDAKYHVGNLFQSGNPLTGQRGTRIDHTWFNAVQEEICAVVEGAGIALDETDDTQLLQAIRRIDRGFHTVEDALAAALPDGTVIAVRNHAAPVDGGGFLGIVEARDSPGNPLGGPIRVLDPVQTFEMYGAVGDGVADDTDALNAAAAADAVILKGMPGKTYRLTDSVRIPRRKSIDLRGSTCAFALKDQVPGFNVTSDGVAIENGTIAVNGARMGGSGPSLSCITIGSQSTGAGFENFAFRKLSLSTNRNDAGGAITVFGGCHNGVIEDIIGPDNADCRNFINIEWGGTSAGTGHPHNIAVRRIKVGRMTGGGTPAGGGYGYVVWVSSAFNVSVTNIHAEEAFGLVSVVAGDRANAHAPSTQKTLIGKGITLDTLACPSVYGYAVRVVGKDITRTKVLEMGLQVSNLHAKGKAETGHLTYGFEVEHCRDVSLSRFSLDGFGVGYATGSDAGRPLVRDGVIANSALYGLQFGSSGKVCFSPRCENVAFIGNNASGGGGTGTAAVLLTKTADPVIRYCIFGVAGESETQKYSIAATIDARRPKLDGNHTYALASGGVAYQMGTSSQTEIAATGANNTAAPGIVLAGGAPIFTIDGTGNRSFGSSGIPVAGTYKTGDRVFFSAPKADGAIGAICVSGGTPGIWKPFGHIPR